MATIRGGRDQHSIWSRVSEGTWSCVMKREQLENSIANVIVYPFGNDFGERINWSV